MRNSVTCPPFPQPKISTRLGPPSVGPTCRDHPRYLLPPQFLHRLLVPRYHHFSRVRHAAVRQQGAPAEMPPNWATTSRLWPGSSRSNGSIGSVKHPVLFIKEKAPSVRHIYRFAILFLTAHPYFTLASDSPSSPESPLPAIGNSPDSMAAVLFPFGVGSW